MPTDIRRASGSSEYVQVNVTSNIDLGTQTVSIATVAAQTTPSSGDFTASTWVTGTGPICTARKPATTYAAGSWDVYVKVIGDVEAPVLYAGRMLVT